MEQSKYLPLYLKHRPQALGELVGQSSVVKTLTNAIDNKRIAHAYLFTGPRGTGKTSSARILAKSLNCEHGPTVTPCLTCVSCVEVRDSSSPSVFEIDAASNNSVDDARMIIERAPLVAQGGKFKLYIVDECHMLTKEAFNALLKTIEEPPPGVIFILATTEEHKVPPTILSRCQRLMFRLVNLEELSAHLKEVAKKENIEIEQDALDLITRRSGGGLRDALGLLDQASLLARPGEPVSQKDLLVLLGALDEDVLLTISRGILERNGQAVLDAVTGLVMQGREPALIAQELAKHFLNLTKASYVNQGGGGETGRFVLGSTQYLEGLIEQAKLFERVELTQMVETLDALEQSLKRSTQPSMSLEIALLSICHRHDIASVRQLENRIVQLEEMIAEGGASLGARPQTLQARPAAGGYPQGAEVLPHHRPQGGGEVLPHHKPASAAPSSEVLPHHQQQSNEVLPHHRPALEQPAAAPPVSAPTAAPMPAPQASVPHQPAEPTPAPQASAPQQAAAPLPTPQVQNEPTGSPSATAESQIQQPPPQIASSAEPNENSESEDDDDAPDVVVSSVQTLPALPPAPALIRGDDSDEEEEEYEGPDSSTADDAEVPYSQTPPTPMQAAPEPAPQLPQEAPAAPPQPAAPPAPLSNDPAGDGELSHAQLERLWSDLLDALHKRSIPAYSLVSMHAFPLRYETKTLTLGVNREFFQKSIENKTNNIVQAYKDISNEEIRVIVKVVADAPSPKGDASAKKSSSSGDSGMATSPAVPQPRPVEHRPEPTSSYGESEPSRVPPATATIPRPEPRPAPAPQTERANRPLPHTPPSETHGEVSSIMGDQIDAGKLKEAYKIFEGPGSRLIMP